ncbi:MAG TPA: lysylphosphatidylglycerol synthase transmembrane domain-containing protein [Candidatus Nanoarchaeia archaeon]|nr:lysylphosphatidylglycerol synthase transmembrane domain-containing protein [Candidatus Nanoarchaeia archaeon]
MKKNLVAEMLSLLAGIALFIIVIRLAGYENLLGAVKGFSPIYSVYFLIVTGLLFLAATYRWKAVLAGQTVNIPLFTLVKYKLAIFCINYFTPSARLGGEPLKVVLLKKQNVKSSLAFASVVVDNFVGMGFDAIIGGVALIILFFSSGGAALGDARKLVLALGVAALAVVAASYLLLVKKKSVFSYILEIFGSLTRSRNKKFFAILQKKVAKTEFYMREILSKKPRALLLAVFFAALSWPLTLLQYKLALLMIGVDASWLQILASVVILSFTTILPIPAALGVQEAGQFTAFRLFSANPHTGIALSLVLRAKDALFLLLSFITLSTGGIDIFKLAGKKFAHAFNSVNGKIK